MPEGCEKIAECIKEPGREMMAAADVEAVCLWMWAHCYPLLENLADGLTDALQEEKITRIAAASAAQVAVLRDIRAAVAAESVSAQMVEQLDTAVENAGEGPFYFNLIVMMYESWAEEYRAAMSIPSTDEEEEEQDQADVPPRTLAGVRRTSVVHVRRPPRSQARMAAGVRVAATHLCPRSQARMAALLTALASM
jgi:hypothetical protein